MIVSELIRFLQEHMAPDRIVRFVNGNEVVAVVQYPSKVVILDEYDAVTIQAQYNWKEVE